MSPLRQVYASPDSLHSESWKMTVLVDVTSDNFNLFSSESSHIAGDR